MSKRGANGNPAEGTGGPKRRRATQHSAPALKVPVPMGTVIKDKKGNLIAELIQPGDGYCICRGGNGGRGTLIPSAKRLQPTTKREAKLEVPTSPALRDAYALLQRLAFIKSVVSGLACVTTVQGRASCCEV